MTLQFPITIVSPDRRVISILRNPRPTRAEYSSATFFTIPLFFFLFTFLVYFIFRFRLLCLTPLDPKKQFSWSCADLCFGAHSPFIPLVPPTAPRRRSRKASRMEHTASASSSSFDGDGASRAHREGNERIQWSKERKTHTERDRESEREREKETCRPIRAKLFSCGRPINAKALRTDSILATAAAANHVGVPYIALHVTCSTNPTHASTFLAYSNSSFSAPSLANESAYFPPRV